MGKRTDLKIRALLSIPQHFLLAKPFWLAYTCVQPGKPARTVILACAIIWSLLPVCPAPEHACPKHDQNLRLIELFTSTLSCCQTHMCYPTCVPLSATQENPSGFRHTSVHPHSLPHPNRTVAPAELGWFASQQPQAKALLRRCPLAVLSQHPIVRFAHSLP